MKLPPFILDQWLAAHEFASPPIRFNLASSTGPPWTLGELIELAGTELRDELDGLRVSYAPPQGSKPLRERIAQFYGVDPDWVVVTTGASEALSILFCAASEPDGAVLLPVPAFPAMPVMAEAWGLGVQGYLLDRHEGFAQRADRILSNADRKTRLALINTPHNPTGSVMAEREMTTLAESLAERNIPLLVDEVYHPLYFDRQPRSAACIPNAIVVSDFSKALSLSGLRLGWIIDRDAERRERLIDLRSYFTISGSPLTEAIATHVLACHDALVSRLRAVAESNLRLLKRFMEQRQDIIRWVPPSGGTVTFPWLLDGRDSRTLCQILAREGVLIVPGDCFGASDHFRMGIGAQAGGFEEALAIVGRVLDVAR